MAARKEISQRKLAMLEDLRAARLLGDGARSETALSQRELSARYDLSGRTVSLLLQQLLQEGVLYTVPRVGTFLGRPPAEAAALYLFVTRLTRENLILESHTNAMQAGFSDQIAQLGGASYAISADELAWHLEQGDLPGVAGIYFFNVPGPQAEDLLRRCDTQGVVYGGIEENENNEFLAGTVDFNDEEGGVQATRHLMALGHRNIAFLGLHGAHYQAGEFGWSALRQVGWRHAMQSGGQDLQKLSFLPESNSPIPQPLQAATARKVAAGMLEAIESRQITAVVAVNVYAAQGLMQALKESTVSREHWPAIVCFDEAPRGATAGISYLRLPWEKIGTEAAQMLWDRRRMPDAKTPQRRLVKMNLVPRLTCRPDWALSGLAQRQIVQAGAMTAHVAQDALEPASL